MNPAKNTRVTDRVEFNKPRVFVAACGSKATDVGKVIKSAPGGNNLTVALATSDGVLKHGNSEFTLTFSDSSDNPADGGAALD